MATEYRLTLCASYETEAKRDAAVTALKAAVVSVGDTAGVVSKAAGANRAEIVKDSYQVSEPVISGRESLAIV